MEVHCAPVHANQITKALPDVEAAQHGEAPEVIRAPDEDGAQLVEGECTSALLLSLVLLQHLDRCHGTGLQVSVLLRREQNETGRGNKRAGPASTRPLRWLLEKRGRAGRLTPEFLRQTLDAFQRGDLDALTAAERLSVSHAHLFRLRAARLHQPTGFTAHHSGGNHRAAWPIEVRQFLHALTALGVPHLVAPQPAGQRQNRMPLRHLSKPPGRAPGLCGRHRLRPPRSNCSTTNWLAKTAPSAASPNSRRTRPAPWPCI